jgi:hypothetical protein
LALEAVALLDPTGTRLPDDGDPFGGPSQAWWVYAPWFATIAGLAALGLRLARRGRAQAGPPPSESL